MKYSQNIARRVLTLSLLLAATTSLGGCGTIYDTITWGPKKIWAATGDKWLGVHQEPQPTLKELGPKRAPVDNPINGVLMNNGVPVQAPKPYSAPQSQFSMQPPQQMPGGFADQDSMDPADLSEARAAYENGGGGAKKKSWFSSLPFFGNYKLEAKFEPLAAEHVVSKEDLKVTKKSKPNRSASMFPLDQFAPQAVNTSIQPQPAAPAEKESYPKLGKIPEIPQNHTPPAAAAATMEKIVNESKDIEKRRAIVHNDEPAANVAPLQNTAPTQSTEAVKKADAPPTAQNETPKPLEANKVDKFSPNDTSPNLIVRTEKSANQNEIKTEILSPPPATVAKETLQSDAAVINKIPTGSETDKKQEETPVKKTGFFSKLFGKSNTPPEPRTWRQAAPEGSNNSTGAEEVVDQNLPSVNMPDDSVPTLPDGNRPLPEAQVIRNQDSPTKKYDSSEGRFLPESRYTGRRKVPQTDK